MGRPSVFVLIQTHMKENKKKEFVLLRGSERSIGPSKGESKRFVPTKLFLVGKRPLFQTHFKVGKGSLVFYLQIAEIL